MDDGSHAGFLRCFASLRVNIVSIDDAKASLSARLRRSMGYSQLILIYLIIEFQEIAAASLRACAAFRHFLDTSRSRAALRRHTLDVIDFASTIFRRFRRRPARRRHADKAIIVCASYRIPNARHQPSWISARALYARYEEMPRDALLSLRCASRVDLVKPTAERDFATTRREGAGAPRPVSRSARCAADMRIIRAHQSTPQQPHRRSIDNALATSPRPSANSRHAQRCACYRLAVAMRRCRAYRRHQRRQRSICKMLLR